MIKITVTRNDYTSKTVKVKGDYNIFEKVSDNLHRANNENKIKWYQVELLKK